VKRHCGVHANAKQNINQENNKYIPITNIIGIAIQFILPYKPKIHAKASDIRQQRNMKEP
jgi:hypothetical protein